MSSDSITLKWDGFRLSKVQWGDKFYIKPGQVCEIQISSTEEEGQVLNVEVSKGTENYEKNS